MKSGNRPLFKKIGASPLKAFPVNKEAEMEGVLLDEVKITSKKTKKKTPKKEEPNKEVKNKDKNKDKNRLTIALEKQNELKRIKERKEKREKYTEKTKNIINLLDKDGI